jgi:hypothetical protein
LWGSLRQLSNHRFQSNTRNILQLLFVRKHVRTESFHDRLHLMLFYFCD